MHTWFHVQLDQIILEGLLSRLSQATASQVTVLDVNGKKCWLFPRIFFSHAKSSELDVSYSANRPKLLQSLASKSHNCPTLYVPWVTYWLENRHFIKLKDPLHLGLLKQQSHGEF